jgi:serine/threonine protein kinase
LNTTFTEKVDIWAVGVVAYELLTGRLPFESPYHKKTVQLIISSEPDFSSLGLTEDLETMLKGLLEKESTLRSGIP